MEEKFYTSAGTLYATVNIDLDENMISDTWTNNFGSQDNFKKVLLYIVDKIEQYRLTKWLANLTDMNGSFDSSRDWLAKEIMPSAIGAGLMKEAVVLPKNIFAKLSTTDTIMRINNFELRQFASINEAQQWLKEGAYITQ